MSKSENENHESPLPAASALMTLPQAAKLLGMKGTPEVAGRRLRRALLAREAEMDRPFMIRIGGGRGGRFLVTIAMLEEHCPELFIKRVQMTELVRDAVEQIEQRLCALDRQDAELAEELLRIKQRTAATTTPSGSRPRSPVDVGDRRRP